MKTCNIDMKFSIVMIGTIFLFFPMTKAEAKEWQNVTIALEGGYEPWNMTKSDGTLIGFEPELAENLCMRMKVKCKLITQDWDGMVPGLKIGKFDVIMDALSITDERKKEIAFSTPYANTPAGFATLKKGVLSNLADSGKIVHLTGRSGTDAPVINTLRKALKGKVIGIQSSTAYSNFIYKNFKDIATIREYKSAAEHDLDIISGRIDVAFDDATYFATAFTKPGYKELTLTGPQIAGPIWGEGEALGLRKNDVELKAKFDTAIKAALADGTVKKLSEKWFKISITP